MKDKKALKQTLDGLIKYARRTGEPGRVRLAKGLTVAVKIEPDGIIALQLSRADVYPAMREWTTVVQQWPGQASVIKEPKPLIDTARSQYYLQGKLRVSVDLMDANG